MTIQPKRAVLLESSSERLLTAGISPEGIAHVVHILLQKTSPANLDEICTGLSPESRIIVQAIASRQNLL